MKRYHTPATENTATDALKLSGCILLFMLCLIMIQVYDADFSIRADRWFPLWYGFGAISIFGIIRYGHRVYDKLNP